MERELQQETMRQLHRLQKRAALHRYSNKGLNTVRVQQGDKGLSCHLKKNPIVAETITPRSWIALPAPQITSNQGSIWMFPMQDLRDNSV